PTLVDDPLAHMQLAKPALAEALRASLEIHKELKWYPMISISFTRMVGDEVARIQGHFGIPAQILLREDEIDDQIDEAINNLIERATNFADSGSGYVLEHVQNFQIN